tara:strand:- start:22232 stop:22612 length:381 start_codon:yes stop_codon:yes gene_type:complete
LDIIKELSVINRLNSNKGLMIYVKGFPIEFIAVNSEFSDRLPVNIIDANKIANGSAMGINVMLEYHSNSMIIFHSNPFPIKSSIYFQRNCINKMVMTIEKVRKNGRIKAEKINFLNIFKSNPILKL